MSLPLLTAAILAAIVNLGAAATFSLTPSTVSNTYNGTITLNISGLTNGESVVVQKFLDLNTNGVIDSGDLLVQQYALTDGKASVIAGVTNINVPGDSTGTNGAIVSQQNFLTAGISGQMVGRYLYKLSSPSGRFTGITNAFTVTQTTYAQSFTGTVRSSGTNVPYASVLLFLPSSGGGMGSPIGGTIASSSGAYTLNAPPGSYLVWAFKKGFVTDFSTVPMLTLNSGATVTTNLSLLPAALTISGKAADIANSALPLPGIMAAWQSTNNLLAVGFTDTNGNFSVPVTPSLWQWGGDQSGLVCQGYLDFSGQGQPMALTTTGSVANASVAFPKGTALFYGTIKDAQNLPLSGIGVFASPNNGGLYEGDGTSDQNGNYVVAVTGGNWNLQVSTDKNPALASYIFSQVNSLTISDGQAVQQNFVAVQATNHISGYLRDNNNNPISGVGIWASATINGMAFNQQGPNTDSTGYYSLNVANGTWDVGVSTCSNCGDGLPGNYLAPASQSVVIANNNSVLNFVAPVASSQITGHVQDSTGNSLGGVGVWANATLNGMNFFQYVNADANGNYSMGVANGAWTVGLEDSGGNGSLDSLLGPGNYQSPNSQSVTINNANGVANFTVQLCSGVQIITTSLPAGQANSYYDVFLQASDCNNNFNWSLNTGSSLPSGLSLGSNGEIYGIPMTQGGYSFTVNVNDGNGHSASQPLSLTINASSQPLQVMTVFLPNATNGTFYSQPLQATGGQAPYSWSLAPYSTALPPNLTLAPSGVLSGTPATSGTFSFYARVTDSAANTADSATPIQLTLMNPPLQITNTTLPRGTVGAAYTQQLGAVGGQPPYSWYLAAGSASLPPGVSLNSGGLISGTPTTNGTFNFLVQAYDSILGYATQPLAILIVGKPVLDAPSYVNNRFQMRLTGAAGQNYTIQMSSDPAAAQWVSLFVTNNPVTNSFIVTDPNATDGRRFYRVKVGP